MGPRGPPGPPGAPVSNNTYFCYMPQNNQYLECSIHLKTQMLILWSL